mmetsp:Transcript_6902/g.19194  ORF Transcript_6902/g.19194 Transcript_6902/m.19194 type:complete len:215 (-) Transcript_6902:265-909(-)
MVNGLAQLTELARREADGGKIPVSELVQPRLHALQYALHDEGGLLQSRGALREAKGRHHDQPRWQVVEALDHAAAQRGEEPLVPALQLCVRTGDANQRQGLKFVEAGPEQVLADNLHQSVVADAKPHHAVDDVADGLRVELFVDAGAQLADERLHEDRAGPLPDITQGENQQGDALGRVHLQAPRGIRDHFVEELAVEDVEARAGPQQVGQVPR